MIDSTRKRYHIHQGTYQTYRGNCSGKTTCFQTGLRPGRQAQGQLLADRTQKYQEALAAASAGHSSHFVFSNF
jgi:hypothetical protein